MPEPQKEDRLRYALSPAESEAIFHVRVVPEYFVLADAAPNQPTAVILGGQPGAGKSMLLHEARTELSARGATVVINGDDFRVYHPQYARLQRDAPEWAAYYTDHDSGRWVEQAIAEAKNRGFNLVIESTMRNPETFEKTASLLHQAGYAVEARALAVPAADSWLGVNQRYEAMIERGGFARWTLPQAHDAGYRGVPQTLQRIEDHGLADRVSVYARDGSKLYENVRTLNGQWSLEPKAAAALEAERGRELTGLETATRAAGWAAVTAKMEARGLSAVEIRQSVEHVTFDDRVADMSKIVDVAKAEIAAERSRIEGGRNDLNRINTDQFLGSAGRLNEAQRVEAEMKHSLQRAETAWGRVFESVVMVEIDRVRTEAGDRHSRATNLRDFTATEVERLNQKGPNQPTFAERLRDRITGRDGEAERRSVHAEVVAGLTARRDDAIRHVNDASAILKDRANGRGPIGVAEAKAFENLFERDRGVASPVLCMRNDVSEMRASVRAAGEVVANLQAERQQERTASVDKREAGSQGDRRRDVPSQERERE